MGNKEALGRGCIQYLSAGTGITHSGNGLCCCSLGAYESAPAADHVLLVVLGHSAQLIWRLADEGIVRAHGCPSSGPAPLPAEMNDGGKTCRFLQVWLLPDQRGHAPQYGSEQYTLEDRKNKLLHLLGGTGRVPDWAHLQRGRCITLHQVGG